MELVVGTAEASGLNTALWRKQKRVLNPPKIFGSLSSSLTVPGSTLWVELETFCHGSDGGFVVLNDYVWLANYNFANHAGSSRPCPPEKPQGRLVLGRPFSVVARVAGLQKT